MARLRVAKDGHRYLTHGYVVVDPAGRLDTQFSTYQLYPGAEWLFREAGLKKGASIPRETFYALLVDGEIYNERRRSGARITSVPMTVRDVAEQKCSELDRLVRLKDIVSPNQSQRTIEWYKALTTAYPYPALRRKDRLDPSTCLSLASWYRLFRASQQ